MKHIDGHYECDYCHGVEGSFYSDTGNHVHCQQIGEQTTKADTHAAELLTLRSDLADAKARAKTAEEKTGHMNNALTTCVMCLVNTNTITEERQVELIKSLRMAGLVDLADSVAAGGFASVFEGVE